MRAWLRRSDFTSAMISSLSFLYLRSCVGDLVEGLDHLGLELGLDRGERQRILHVVVVEVALALRLLAAFRGFAVAGGLERGGGRRRRRGRGGLRLHHAQMRGRLEAALRRARDRLAV